MEAAHTDLDADVDRIRKSLRLALQERVPAEKNYHVRSALQDLVVLADRLEQPIAPGRRERFELLRE